MRVPCLQGWPRAERVCGWKLPWWIGVQGWHKWVEHPVAPATAGHRCPACILGCLLFVPRPCSVCCSPCSRVPTESGLPFTGPFAPESLTWLLLNVFFSVVGEAGLSHGAVHLELVVFLGVPSAGGGGSPSAMCCHPFVSWDRASRGTCSLCVHLLSPSVLSVGANDPPPPAAPHVSRSLVHAPSKV